MRCFSREDRLAAAWRDEQVEQVAKGMDHPDKAQACQQKNQGMTQRQVVVDGANQHDHQRQGEEQAAARRHDKNPPLAEPQGAGSIAAPAKQALLERCQQLHDVQGMATLRISAAMSSDSA